MFQQTIFDKKSKKIKTEEDFKRPKLPPLKSSKDISFKLRMTIRAQFLLSDLRRRAKNFTSNLALQRHTSR